MPECQKLRLQFKTTPDSKRHGDQHCTPTVAKLQAGRDGRIKLICSDSLCQYAAQCDAFHNLKQLLQLHYY
jgi:hypothetical protein